MFSYVDVESRMPAGHPIRKIRKAVDQALAGVDDVFNAMHAKTGHSSIPPEQLLRALVVRTIHTIRSERQLMERVNPDMLFRWFVGLSLDDPAWHPATFTKNRGRLLAHGVDERFLAKVNEQAQARQGAVWLGQDHGADAQAEASRASQGSLAVVVLWGHRSLIPLMYLLLVIEVAFRLVAGAIHPLTDAHYLITPPGAVANLPMLAAYSGLLALSLRRPRNKRSAVSPGAR